MRMADTLRARDLHRRIPNDGSDQEFRALVDVLNGMIGDFSHCATGGDLAH